MVLSETLMRPIVSGPNASGTMKTRPSASSTAPGFTRKKLTPWTSMARRFIQPARHGSSQPRRFMWLSRPSGSLRKWIGTSAVSSSMCTDLSTISEAYSQPCERRSMRASASRLMPRMPQWMSEKRLPNIRLRMKVVTGVPK